MTETDHPNPDLIEMPAPTAWPLALALAITLLAIGLVTSLALSIVGGILGFISAVGWFRRVYLPEGQVHEQPVPPERRAREVHGALGAVETMAPGMPGSRLAVPENVHPYSAGAKGGVVGGLVMPIPALAYGVLSGHGIWYPVNLLAGMVMTLPSEINELEKFHFGWLVIGTVIHVITSVVLGLIYGVLLPMLPGRPIIWGGVVAPLLWSGAVYGFMGVLNPVMQQHVFSGPESWYSFPAFLASQFIYGIAVGLVVVRSEQIYVGHAAR